MNIHLVEQLHVVYYDNDEYCVNYFKKCYINFSNVIEIYKYPQNEQYYTITFTDGNSCVIKELPDMLNDL